MLIRVHLRLSAFSVYTPHTPPRRRSPATGLADSPAWYSLSPYPAPDTLNNSPTPSLVKSSVGAPTRCASAGASRLTASSGRQRVFIAALSAGNGRQFKAATTLRSHWIAAPAGSPGTRGRWAAPSPG